MADSTRTADSHITRSVADGNATIGHDPGPFVSPLAPTDGMRYQLGTEIARGGMGVVYRATDTAFGREVAVKVLLDKFPPTSNTARRFLVEARIAAQLQHPGIPPVHDLGTLPDGRPFLAMKLIDGETFGDRLNRRADPATDRGQFLVVFEQVCQAIGYAHAHGVIHRDLKPANIMVGEFGEVQVMDWGLAKVLPPSPLRGKGVGGEGEQELPSDPISIRSQRDSDWSETQAGVILGTPAFMPPEQAIGDVDQIDARSDVFGLGGLLAVILTGHPTFVGHSVESTRTLAEQGQVNDCFARLDASGAAPELVALAKRCLAPDQAGRPTDAGAVATAVAELRVAADERARRAEIDREKAEVETREQRKRRRVQVLLAAAVVLLMVGGGAFAWWRDHQTTIERARLERNAEAVAALLDQAEQALKADEVSKATTALNAAGERMTDGGADESAERLARLRDDLESTRELDSADRFGWTPIGGKFPDTDVIARRYRDALTRFGIGADTPADVVAQRITRSAVRDRLVLALDQMLILERSDQALAVLRAVDADTFRDAVREAVHHGNARAAVELAGRPEATAQPPEFAAVLGGHPAVPPARRREILTAAVRAQPSDPLLLIALGKSYPINQREGATERVRWFQAAAAVAPTNPSVHNLLGIALMDLGDPTAAAAVFRACLRHTPDDYVVLGNLGNALAQTNDTAGAISVLREALRIAPDYSPARGHLITALRQKREFDAAEDECREAIRRDPYDANSHINLGLVLRAKNDLPGAIAAYREAIRLAPNNAIAHSNLGAALHYDKKLDDAIISYREAVRLDQKYAAPRMNLGVALKEKGELKDAIAAIQEAARLDTTTAGITYELANTLGKDGQYDAAEAAFRETIRRDPTHPEAHCNLGQLLFRALNRPADALPFLRKGHELGSKRKDWRYPSARWVAECEKAAEPPRKE